MLTILIRNTYITLTGDQKKSYNSTLPAINKTNTLKRPRPPRTATGPVKFQMERCAAQIYLARVLQK